MEDILVPITFFALIAGVVLLPAWLKSRERLHLQDTVRHAVDKGQSLPPELIESIAKSTAKPPATASRDLRIGVILLSLAAGVFTTFYLMGQAFDEDIVGAGSFAAIPGFIGLAFVILSFFNKNKG